MNISFLRTIWIFFAWIVRGFVYSILVLILLFGVGYVAGIVLPQLEGSIFDISTLKHAMKDEKALDNFLKQHPLSATVAYIGFYVGGFIIQIYALKVTIQKNIRIATNQPVKIH